MNDAETLDGRLRAKGFALERIAGERDAETGAVEMHLALRDLEDENLSPLAVDFTSGALLHRLKHGLSKNQPLGKALGLKSLDPAAAPFVIDATAGLGTDTLVMAALGCRVRAIERSDAIFELLSDGKDRLDKKALDEDDLLPLARRFSFELGDATQILSALEEHERPEVVYLDPMYPNEGKHKSALPKKTMQMFRRLLDGDEDADQLWRAAMKAARKRVVVKRPLKAPFIGGDGAQKPAHTFEGKTARLDLYLIS